MDDDPASPATDTSRCIIDTRPLPPIDRIWIEADSAAHKDGGEAIYVPRSETAFGDAVTVRGQARKIIRRFVNWSDARGGAFLVVSPPAKS